MAADIDLVLNYSQVLQELSTTKTVHLLLGNGFSIGCDPIYSYSSLIDYASPQLFSPEVSEIFRALNTVDFERVMRTLTDCSKINTIYGNSKLSEDCMSTVNLLGRALVQAIAKRHLPFPEQILSSRKTACKEFLGRFNKIFTSNYDLNLCWVIMAASKPSHGDGFKSDPKDPESEDLVFSRFDGSRPSIHYLHGALHLFVDDGRIKKHCWVRSGKRIMAHVEEALQHGGYPLFVAGGTSSQKMDLIVANEYLGSVFHRFRGITGTLIILGHSLSESDNHICETIGWNLELTKIYVGLHGDQNSPSNEALKLRAKRIQEIRRRYTTESKFAPVPLEVIFFQSETALVWGKELSVQPIKEPSYQDLAA